VTEADPYVKVLLYGPNGHGKTRTAATGPKTIILDVNERGTRSVRNYPDVHVFRAKSWEDVVYFYWYLKAGDHDHETVVIDTLTSMQMVCLNHTLKEAEDRDPAKDPALASQRDYGKVNTLMKNQMLFFRNLPMHVIFVAQERAIDNEDGDPQRVPNLSPGCRGTAQDCADYIGRIFKKEVRAVNQKTKKETKKWVTLMLIGPHEVFITKDRSGELDRVVKEPTIPMIIAANNITLEA
jgi:phage nucleotide-binding protein